ncbi:MAG TPA: hypothetical protein VFO16_00140 [Pseudonocardiaceae bacterium]|nr:hypothetical protein [Pseudonocardiaceae bacterium]
MSAFHPTRYRLLDEELSSLLDAVLVGGVVQDPAVADRLARFLSAATSLHRRHVIDRHGRCVRCAAQRPWWLWRRPRSCSVYSTLVFCLTQQLRFVLPTFMDGAGNQR